MMLRALSGALVLSVAFSSYCYSDTVASGTTNNVVTGNTYQWSMQNVLPSESGLVVNGVIYRYTVNKETGAQLEVTVQNENALGPGYIFSETDNWSGRPANTINKSVPTSIPGEYWGDGEIVLNGDGSISDVAVAYNYTYDLCANPLINSDCPGYFDALYQWLLDNGLINSPPDINDPFYDEWVQAMLNRETDQEEEEKEEEEEQVEEEEKKEQSDLAKAFFAADAANQIANSVTEQAKMDALTNVPNFDSYQETTIPGGTYEESVTLSDSTLPDNPKALRNFAQDKLHKEMIRSQYND